MADSDKLHLNAPEYSSKVYKEYSRLVENSSGHNKTTVYKKLRRDDIIGLPPAAYYSQPGNSPTNLVNKVLDSMPVVSIIPAFPNFNTDDDTGVGLKLYNADVKKGKEKYEEIIKNCGIDKFTLPIQIAFLNDTTFSDSISNEFGESKFEEIGNSASSLISDVRLITGEESGREAFRSLGEKAQQGGLMGDIAGGLAKGAGWFIGGGESALNALSPGLGKILSGSKINFPKVWRGSSYDQSYTITSRLYSSNADNEEEYFLRIIKPIIKIAALAIPITDKGSNGYTFSSPLLVKADAAGLFRIDSGFISSIEIIKGGDNNSINFKQRPNVVDLRLTIQGLYNTLVHDSEDTADNSERPTLKKFVYYSLGQYLGPTQIKNNTPGFTFIGDPEVSPPGVGSTASQSTEAPDRISGDAKSVAAQLDSISAITAA